jgi:hypothetical protein
LEQWVAENHSAAVTIHPRALDGAKKSRYQDVKLIYAAINFLGNE